MVPLRAMAQALLPGTDAVPVPLQLMPFTPMVACADPLPDICTLPLQVAENVPDTDVAVMFVMLHVNAPQVPDCEDAACTEDHVPTLRPAARAATEVEVDGDVIAVPQPTVVRNAASASEPRSRERMGRTLARLRAGEVGPSSLSIIGEWLFSRSRAWGIPCSAQRLARLMLPKSSLHSFRS